jgi:hypothetical protein
LFLAQGVRELETENQGLEGQLQSRRDRIAQLEARLAAFEQALQEGR